MSLFDPAEWIDIGDGRAIHRADLKPCKCGGTAFEVVRLTVQAIDPQTYRAIEGETRKEVRSACRACRRNSSRALRTEILGTIDAVRKTFRPKKFS